MQDFKVCIYCRVGNANQLSADMLTWQQEQMIQFAKEKEFNIFGIYSDVGSALSKCRKELDAVMEIARSGEIDAILVKDTSRISHGMIDFLEIAMELKKYGVCLLTPYNEIGRKKEIAQDQSLRLLLARIASY